jgi:hypothetical protein
MPVWRMPTPAKTAGKPLIKFPPCSAHPAAFSTTVSPRRTPLKQLLVLNWRQKAAARAQLELTIEASRRSARVIGAKTKGRSGCGRSARGKDGS